MTEKVVFGKLKERISMAGRDLSGTYTKTTLELIVEAFIVKRLRVVP